MTWIQIILYLIIQHSVALICIAIIGSSKQNCVLFNIFETKYVAKWTYLRTLDGANCLMRQLVVKQCRIECRSSSDRGGKVMKCKYLLFCVSCITLWVLIQVLRANRSKLFRSVVQHPPRLLNWTSFSFTASCQIGFASMWLTSVEHWLID